MGWARSGAQETWHPLQNKYPTRIKANQGPHPTSHLPWQTWYRDIVSLGPHLNLPLGSHWYGIFKNEKKSFALFGSSTKTRSHVLSNVLGRQVLRFRRQKRRAWENQNICTVLPIWIYSYLNWSVTRNSHQAFLASTNSHKHLRYVLVLYDFITHLIKQSTKVIFTTAAIRRTKPPLLSLLILLYNGVLLSIRRVLIRKASERASDFFLRSQLQNEWEVQFVCLWGCVFIYT